MYISIIKWVKGHWQQFFFGGIFRVDHVNTIPWWAIFTRSTSAHFSKMIWFISCTSHLSKCRTFGALLDVASSAVFFNDLTDPLQKGSGRGCFCFWPLLRCFGGVFYFLRLSTALILSADVPVLDDCPLMTLTWALVASANRQISKHFSGDSLGSCNKFRRTLLSAIPQTRRSLIISFFNSHIKKIHPLPLELSVLQSKQRLIPEVLVFNSWACNVRR